jgi:hypothetical protein
MKQAMLVGWTIGITFYAISVTIILLTVRCN